MWLKRKDLKNTQLATHLFCGKGRSTSQSHLQACQNIEGRKRAEARNWFRNVVLYNCLYIYIYINILYICLPWSLPKESILESWKKLCMHCPKFDETQRSGWCQKIARMLLCWFFEGSLFGWDRGSRSTPNAAKRILCTPLQQQTTKIAHERLGPKSFHWLDLWKGFRPVVQKNLPGLIRFSSLSSSGLWSSLHGTQGTVSRRTLAVPDCPQKAQLPGTKAKESKTIVNTCNLGVTWYDHTLPRNNNRNKVHQGICGSCNSSPIHALPALQSTALESPQLATVTVRVEPAVQSQKKKSKSVTAKAKVFVSPTNESY